MFSQFEALIKTVDVGVEDDAMSVNQSKYESMKSSSTAEASEVIIDGIKYQRVGISDRYSIPPNFTVLNIPKEDKVNGSKKLLLWKAK